ncbi:hypothetical protein RJ639_006918 [Escallonia herrerae]|uniref:DUF7054 domain-containing protein n=1 Tax=Escallonia herrerae TaxID=1293975 RepID=A0AA88VZ89_9ASTE|nr:hypothetical protein RJ639_006918 [Escallonia herrerae]
MLLYKQKKSQAGKGNRLLISITVIGSAGPIRFVVSEGELVAAVIDTALKSYAREGRLPILGSDLNSFVLYCPNAGTEDIHCILANVDSFPVLDWGLNCVFELLVAALSPWETIGSLGVRNFMLCKKPQVEKTIDDGKTPVMARKGSGSWKAWFNKSLNLKISSH